MSKLKQPKPIYTFETFRGGDHQWYWRVVHRNGNFVAVGGEGYARRGSALTSARRAQALYASAGAEGLYGLRAAIERVK